MIPVQLTKERAAYLVDCLGNGKAIEPPPGGWTGNDYLALAGAAFAAAMNQGPEHWWHRENDVQSMQTEHREHVLEVFDHDLHAAIGMYSQLAFAALDEVWDENFEQEVCCLVTQEGTLKKNVKVVSGFKLES